MGAIGSTEVDAPGAGVVDLEVDVRDGRSEACGAIGSTEVDAPGLQATGSVDDVDVVFCEDRQQVID